MIFCRGKMVKSYQLNSKIVKSIIFGQIRKATFINYFSISELTEKCLTQFYKNFIDIYEINENMV